MGSNRVLKLKRRKKLEVVEDFVKGTLSAIKKVTLTEKDIYVKGYLKCLEDLNTILEGGVNTNESIIDIKKQVP